MVLKEEMATHPSILARRVAWTEEPAGYSQWGHEELDTTERLTCMHAELEKTLYSVAHPLVMGIKLGKKILQRKRREMCRFIKQLWFFFVC